MPLRAACFSFALIILYGTLYGKEISDFNLFILVDKIEQMC